MFTKNQPTQARYTRLLNLLWVLGPSLGLLGLFILPTIALSAQPPPGPETMLIQPSGVVTWAEMQQAEALSPPVAPAQVVVVPNPPLPAPKEIDSQAAPATPLLPIEPDPGGGIGPLAGATLTNGFAALEDNNTSIPPDTMGAVGPAHLVTMLNTQVRIQNKAGGNISTVSLATFWTSGTGVTGSPFDPRVIYDSLSGRWMATIDLDSSSTTSSIAFAISASSDPTGTWTFYEFDADAANLDWADFPDIGTNSKWIAITNNMFTVSASTFQGAKMWVIDKSTALAGGALTLTVFNTGFDNGGGFTSFTLRTALTFDTAEPALYLVDNGFLSVGQVPLLRLSRITGTVASPTWEVVPGSTILASSGLFLVNTPFEYSQIDAAQSGTATTVETNDPRLQNAVFRNGRLWTTHPGGLPFDNNQATTNADRTAVFWYELDPAAMTASGAPIVQSGAIDGGSGVHHFFPSLAVNANNEMAIGFSRSDSSRFVEAVITGRQANDPAGTVDPLTVIKAGEDSYVKDFGFGRIRWGDYSATAIDPADDLTFWTTQEYAETDVGATASDDRWGTWWGQLVFRVDLALTKTTTITTIDPGQPLTYTLTVANNGPATATSVVVSDTLPATLDFVSANPSQGSYNSNSGAWAVGNLNDGGLATLSLMVKPKLNTSGQTITNTAVISAADQPEIISNNNNGVAAITVNVAPALSITKSVALSSPPTADRGEVITYTVVVANEGGADATAVRITDTLPSGVTGLNLATMVTVMAGKSITFVIPAIVASDAPFDTVITNTAIYSHSSSSTGQAKAAFTTNSKPKTYLPLIIK